MSLELLLMYICRLMTENRINEQTGLFKLLTRKIASLLSFERRSLSIIQRRKYSNQLDILREKQ